MSGGEVLLQIQPLTELLRKAKALGINTCLDTLAQLFNREPSNFFVLEELIKYTDLVLLDIRYTGNDAHKQLTGWENENIPDCARYLPDIGKPVWVRHVLIPGINDDDELLSELCALIGTLSNVERVEILPYHSSGVYKWEQLGIPYALTDVESPTGESVLHAREILTEER